MLVHTELATRSDTPPPLSLSIALVASATLSAALTRSVLSSSPSVLEAGVAPAATSARAPATERGQISTTPPPALIDATCAKSDMPKAASPQTASSSH